MKITCPKCNATYNVSTSKIPPGKKAAGTCKKCGQKIVVSSSVEEMIQDNFQVKKSIQKEIQPEKNLETEQRTEKQKDARAKEGKKKSAFFKRIETVAEANEVIKGASYLFIIVAIIYGLMGFFLAPDSLIDAVAFFILALLLMFLKSRIVAVLLLLFSSGVFISTSLTKLGIIKSGGSNIFLALFVLWDSIKAVEATFKLHGKFKTRDKKGSTSNE